MFHRSQSVLALIALAACVGAMPQPGANDISDTNIKSSHGKATAIKTQNEKPVNKRFPHAVLFGATCGGTIISPTWVITAAHCTIGQIGSYVIAGTNRTDDQSGVFQLVKRVVIHPLFFVGPYWVNAESFNLKQVAASHDFLLVELEEPLPLDGQTIKAATLNDDVNLPAGLNVGYAGYGTDHFKGTMSDNMHAMELSLQSNNVCAQLEQYDAQNMLCAKGRPPRYDSACSGDSGSGLVDESGRLLGVASWVENDAKECRNGNLVVFSRISSVRDWIKNVTGI